MIFCYTKSLIVIVLLTNRDISSLVVWPLSSLTMLLWNSPQWGLFGYLGWKIWSRDGHGEVLTFKVELPFLLLLIKWGGYFILLNVIGASQEGRKFPASGMWRSWSGLVKNPGGAVSPHPLQHLLFG